MNSEMYVTGNDCYGSGGRAILMLSLFPLSLSLLSCISLRWCADRVLEGSDMNIKPSRRRWTLKHTVTIHGHWRHLQFLKLFPKMISLNSHFSEFEYNPKNNSNNLFLEFHQRITSIYSYRFNTQSDIFKFLCWHLGVTDNKNSTFTTSFDYVGPINVSPC